jgi:hypothetical protein
MPESPVVYWSRLAIVDRGLCTFGAARSGLGVHNPLRSAVLVLRKGKLGVSVGGVSASTVPFR